MKKMPLFFLPLILFIFIPLVLAHTITVPTTVHFGLTTYGTYINFNTAKTFNNVYRENNYWYFDGYGFQVQNANMSISNFFTGNKLVFTVSAPSGTSTTEIYCGDRSKPGRVTGAKSWSYNKNTKICTVTVQHSSPATVTLDWSPNLPSYTFDRLFTNIYFSIGLLSLGTILVVAGFLFFALKGGGLQIEGGLWMILVIIIIAVCLVITLLIIPVLDQVFT